jgi:hypothetical protein
MDKRKKNITAVIVIAIIFLLYMIAYVCLIFAAVPFPINAIFGIVPTRIIIAFIHVCLARIREIDEGNDDDLDKY